MPEDPDDVIGGGAVNERRRSHGPSSPAGRPAAGPPRTARLSHASGADESPPSPSTRYNPSLHRSHLLHAIEGLDRYPNYLSRWSPEDADRLERALEERLDRVREQRLQVSGQRNEMRQVLQSVLSDHPHWRDLLREPESWDEVRDRVLDGRAAEAVFRSDFFRSREDGAAPASVRDVLSGRVPVALDGALLLGWMDEEMFDVYSFPLLAESFCASLRRFLACVGDALDAATQAQPTPPSPAVGGGPTTVRPTRGIRGDLDNLGLGWLNDLLFHLVVRPVSAHLYRETELAGGDLDWRQGFVAAYSASPTQSKPRQRLVPHTDDAEVSVCSEFDLRFVPSPCLGCRLTGRLHRAKRRSWKSHGKHQVTLNVCLGDKFAGGSLRFWGVRGGPTAGRLLGEYRPEIGRAVLHSGRHLHEVTEVTDGDRFAYIQWARSWDSARRGTCPCCWLNRREQQARTDKWDPCVCGSRWN
jgi:hypothetical protein